MTTPKRMPGMLKDLLQSWFGLTNGEQKAVLIVLALFLLGLVARYWHLHASAG